ncbi:hypothetical protein ABH922_003084 [Rhodococcus sp. 27YEA15]|uniref:hypothetical protein n=1 Tax=Rhodococcus sp. 27YEA15 TaxID=3156259 RepID=UPI003C7E2734
MNITEWWPILTRDTRDWLIEHNGEPLDPAVLVELLAVNSGRTDPAWWSDESDDGSCELTDEAVDWIEWHANGEDSGT